MKPDIDLSRRKFIKASLVLAGAFVLGKVSGLLSLTSAVSSPAHTPSVGTKEYKNARYGFSLLHPSDLTVKTFDEGDGASTITFQNVEKSDGFQIFITPHKPPMGEVPYNGTEENEQRIGSSYRTNPTLGAIYEMRMVHGEFLYELTTLKLLATQLDAIIKTWKFA